MKTAFNVTGRIFSNCWAARKYTLIPTSNRFRGCLAGLTLLNLRNSALGLGYISQAIEPVRAILCSNQQETVRHNHCSSKDMQRLPTIDPNSLEQ